MAIGHRTKICKNKKENEANKRKKREKNLKRWTDKMCKRWYWLIIIIIIKEWLNYFGKENKKRIKIIFENSKRNKYDEKEE